MRRSICLILFVSLSACSGGDPILTCEDDGNAHPICGFQNPEDLALLDDGQTVVVSQYGSMTEDKSGSLALFDLDSESLRVVFPRADVDETPVEPVALAGWGDPQCPGPPGLEFNPHGLDLATRPDGKQQLLVVNHGGRESVEFFEVTHRAGVWSIDWRGCAVPPGEAYFNDVVALPDGGFLATHMMPRTNAMWGMLRASLGANTGSVYEWQPGRGYASLPGTEAPFPNGIEISPDGQRIYVNLYTIGEIRSYDRATGELLGSVEVASPDNLSWAQDGRLLVASHNGTFGDQRVCMTLDGGSCPMAFAILAIDPVDWNREVLYENAGPPMGGGTVAIDIGDGLLIGTFAGDRVLRVRR